MFSFAKEPQSIGEVLADSFSLYRSTLAKVLPVSALAMLVGAIASLLRIAHIVPVINANNIQQLIHTTDVSVIISVGLFFTITALFSVFLIAVLIHGMYTLALGQGLIWAESLRIVAAKLPAIFLGFTISTLFIVLGFMIFFFPGIFISIMLMFYMPIALFDSCGGLTAMERSWKLVWGNWWSTFFAILVPTLISIFLMSLMATIAKQNEILLMLVSFVVMSLFTPFFYAVMLVQFNNLKFSIR